MTKREVAILACRIMALFVLVNAIEFVAYFLPSMALGIMIGFGVIGAVALVVLAALLWFRAGVVAAWLVNYDIQDDQYEPEVLRIDASLDDLIAIIVALVGLWLVIRAATTFISLFAAILQASWQVDDFLTSVLNQVLSNAVLGSAFELAIGIWLIFGSQRIVGWLRRVKNVGIETTAEKPSLTNSTATRDNN